jgi:lysyl-tRNA synthetase class 2
VSRRAALVGRARILRGLRRWFEARDFVEIEAPVAVVSPGLEPHLLAFELATEGPRRYLHTSPEYALKRLLGEGFDRLFSVGPCFRDEPPSRTHSPEFTMLEWYAVGLDLPGLMAQTEQLVAAACAAAHGGTVTPQGLDLTPPFRRLSVRQAFIDHAGVDPWLHGTAAGLRAAGRAAGVAVPTDSAAWDDVFFQIFLNVVEPAIESGPPTFLWGWPASQAALARLDPADPTVALRFELFAGGVELANAFDELTDPVEQRARFEADQADRVALGMPVPPIDEALLDALGRMRPTSGIALGVDRLVMLILGIDDIREVRAQSW